MYKVYLSPSNSRRDIGVNNFGLESYRMNEITDEIEKELIKSKDFVVYRNKPEMTIQEIIDESNSINPNIHLAIHTNCSKKQGIESYPKVGCDISNGFAKEIYNNLMKIYYNKEIDNGVMYDDKIIETMNVTSPAVLIKIGCHESIENTNWIINNKKEIGMKIAEGIIKGVKLRPC